MQFSNPLWLWALSGMLLPLGIHLLSRREGKIIPFGSNRFLQATPTAKFRHIKLNEIALLLLRCLLVILLVFLVAGFELNIAERNEKWVVLEDGIQRSAKIQSLLKKLRRQGFDVRLMATGFPPVERAGPHKLFEDYWAAVNELADTSTDSIVVISYNYQRKFRGTRPALPDHIRWVSHDVDDKEFEVQTIRIDNDSLWTRTGYTSATVTYFETKPGNTNLQDSLPVASRQQLRIRIVKEADYDYDYKVLVASLNAIQTITPHALEVVTATDHSLNDSSAAFTFWLADDIPKNFTKRNITVALRVCTGKDIPLIMSSSEAATYCRETGNETWVITKRLNEDVALKESLAIQLARIILPRVTTQIEDRRTVPEHLMWSSSSHGTGLVDSKPKNDTNPLLIMLLLLVFSVERFLAYKRNQ